ncbi:C2H2 and C2HC zinc finger [Pochonia chlamydosporia 170]|uniref:C2H2 and C2HC zinc finger n=1 Tax=Pochonia chlamydosporia 170 TaxID=1380566 RepID=A0A179FCG7_METCM|nr:C2H2 and C2HC zinc finger [Pochonia chlamydosporia 170]OAQ62753.1 C2H2 and C2HC zinc finger [Pochonia chlamydosporia 170]
MPPAEVHRQAKENTDQIFSHCSLLKAIVDRHEAKIQTRWEKKTRTQRLKILLTAWPDMPTTHRPEFAAFRKHPNRLHEAAADSRGSFTWPYINQEDLAKPRSLPLLLNARARNHPSVFAAADGDAMHLGRVSMVLVPIFLNTYVMTLNGMTKQADYGRLMSWDDHEDAFDWMHTRKQFLPGEGLAILEAQSRLLEFLVCCCQQILHEIPPENLTSDIYPIEEEPSLKSNHDPTGLTSLATLADEAPYRVPATLDLQNIESLLAARASRAEEHVWALREDPSYFADQLLEAREHRLEMLKDVNGNAHPTLRFPREKYLWARVIDNVVLEATLQLDMFSQLHDQACKLKVLQTKHAAEISPLKDLPEEYLVALLKFHHYLEQLAKGLLNQLKTAFPASLPMRKFFVRAVPESPSSSKISVTQKTDIKMDKTTEQLMWLLRTLWEDGRNLFLCRVPVVVDELDRLIQTDQKVRDLLSPYIVFLIGELSIIAECLRQIQIYQPWANGFENALVDREDGIKTEFASRTKGLSRILEALREDNVVKLVPYGDPSDNKFDYPVGRRRNMANVEKLRAAEANLDIFWVKIDELLYSQAGNMDGTALKRLLAKGWPLERTPPWVEPVAKKAGEGNKVSKPDIDAPTKPFSSLFISSEEPSAKKEVLAGTTVKSKVKSRGTPTTSAENKVDVTPGPAHTQASPPPLLLVDNRALKVFRIVIFDPAANTTPGEVAWNDFLHAMRSVGFGAQKLYGSVWHFQPTTLAMERSIQFHEPHPRGKIPFLIARRHGRRLSRAYGWSVAMFALKDKGA